MSGLAVKTCRQHLGLTQSGLAALLRSDLRTIQRWEAGERAVNGPVTVAIEALLSGWRPQNETGPETE